MAVPRTHAFICVHKKGRTTQKGWAGYGWRHVYVHIYRYILHEIKTINILVYVYTPYFV